MLFYFAASAFWLSAFLVAYAYVLYPYFLGLWSRGRTLPKVAQQGPWPRLSIFMAVYNEEAVLAQKLDSIFESDYPLNQVEIFIGSDSSTDQTEAILAQYAARYPQLQYRVYQRRGKAGILNALHQDFDYQGEVLVYTDANVLFQTQTLKNLVRHFSRPEIGQVGAAFVNRGLSSSGISRQESAYIRRETRMKYQEGLLWGSMMGAFGGCHAIRASLYVPNPPHFLMEDFYISMHVLKQGYQAVLDIEAEVLEDLPQEVKEEYRRKIRISAGNFQNLSVFYPLLAPWRGGLALAFWSHKVLRWLGPFWLIISFLGNFIAAFIQDGNLFYQVLFYLQIIGFLCLPILDWLLQKAQIHLSLLRYLRYFLAMNLALLQGFFVYLKGVRTNVWQPTKRNTP